MSKKKFNPKDWVEPTANQSLHPSISLPSKSPSFGRVKEADIDIITKRIESAAIDIAPNYADWRDLGFALADALAKADETTTTA